MTKYESIYNFSVISEIGKGNTVYVIDKAFHNSIQAIRKVNDLSVDVLFAIINNPKQDNRFEFYKIIESEKKNEQ